MKVRLLKNFGGSCQRGAEVEVKLYTTSRWDGKNHQEFKKFGIMNPHVKYLQEHPEENVAWADLPMYYVNEEDFEIL